MELNAKNMKKIMLLIVFAVILFWGFQNYAVLLKASAYLAGIARPFVIGLCIAFILNVLLRLLENGWERVWRKRNRGAVKRLQRPVCLLLSIGVNTGAVQVLMLMIVPEIVKTVTKVIEAVPAYIDELEPKYKELVERLKLPFGSLPSLEIDREKIMAVVVDYLKKGGPSLFSKTAGFTASVFSGLFTFILAFVFSIYVLLQKETLAAQVKKLLAAYVPEKKAGTVLRVSRLASSIFSKFVTGQLSEALLFGLLCYAGMKTLRMPFAAMTSALIGVTALIPYFGAFIGTGVGAFLILMENPVKALWFVVFIIILQQIDNKVIYPRVVGQSVGLPGIWVLIAITVGGSVFGIAGMVLSVPLCSVMYCLVRQAVARRLKDKAVHSEELS